LAEPLVLRALSNLGGGSVRSIGGGTDPTQSAAALLHELTTPAVRDLTLEWSGVAVAAVYPETLPNLPAGSQQIVLGRFDTHAGRKGKVRVKGSFAGKSLLCESDVDLGGAGAEESFVPRLWARHHLDHLLAQGSDKQTKERVIALSEEFQIATPYTSFLVL